MLKIRTDYKTQYHLFKDYFFTALSTAINYPLVKPKSINLEITERCPLSCVMCNIKNKNRGEKGELTLGQLEEIVDQAKSWGINHISFAGGETLVRKDDTIKTIAYAAERGMRTELITNGHFLDYETCKSLLTAGLSKLAISVDGANKTTHDFIRGKGSFEKAMQAAKNLAKLRKNAKIELEFTTTVMSHNFRELIDVYELMKKSGFDFINYQALVPDNSFQNNGNGNFSYDSSLWINENDIRGLERVVEKIIEIKKRTGDIRNSESYLKLIPKYFAQKNKFKTAKCLAGYTLLNVDAYGNISACSFGPNLNINKSNLLKIWKSKEFNKTRKLIKNCRQPCLMLCYEKLSLKDFYKSFMQKKLRPWKQAKKLDM